ncbi:multiheme cytochrome [Candidatus Koribacter versatilis Ellin345]|uniref:Multiheme cytochrome n=1 Tax=Koribacter versatilis (strain Ellin345) TaxID=204669 RepID=Q1ITP8_KORVE|nr:cytochrome c3 family protein [Candidatus Koribacter versatilis]ABF39752.1 multiheme cytochrome [Candidatus Koribacter versatilis Ellin345]
MSRLGLFAILSMVIGVGQAVAATHPVPLDPKTDSAKCIECHGEKSKGKNVHSAIAMGCTSCHEVRVNRNITRVKLVATTTSGVCFTCHADKKASEIKGQVHAPAVRDCVKCHDPHQSDNKNQLLKPTSGETSKENICLTCHTKGMNVPQGGSRHAALDMGCETCHVTHKTGERGKREFDNHLTKDAPGLCLDCHDAKDASLQKAHQGQPFGTADCLTCHDPHQSKSPKLMQAFQHMPFEGRQCDACHSAPKDGKVVLTAADSKAVCVTCHAEKAEQIEKAKVQHPGAMGDCTTCHNPHAGKQPAFPTPNGVAACTSCHSDQAELQKTKAHLHQPAFQQGCATCHEPHGGENQHLLRAASTNALCLECHGPDPQPKKLEADHLVTIFNDKVKLPENYFQQVPTLPIKYGRGHPVEGHPVSDIMDLTDGNKVVKSINCLTCHQPHASAKDNLLVKDQEANGKFCETCHSTQAAPQPTTPKTGPKTTPTK